MRNEGWSRPWRIATLAVVATAVISIAAAAADRQMEFTPIQELRGLKAIRVEVDGLPSPLDGSEVSERSIQQDVAEALRGFGLTIAQHVTSSVPTFRVTVLVPRFDATYAYTIHARLEEPCSAQRQPEVVVPWCVTWSAFPRIGFLRVTEPSALRPKVLEAVTHFGLQWAIENGPGKKP